MGHPNTYADAVILGAGPAGVVAAKSLHEDGLNVFLVGKKRGYAVFEGLSNTTYSALQAQGLHHTCEAIPPATSRRVLWGPDGSRHNTERVVYRPALEDGLLADINAAQMPFIHGHVGKCAYDGQMWQIKSPIGDVLTPLLIDARGRQAPNRGTAPSEDVIRGLPTIAINQAYFLSADQNSSPIDELTLIALEDGWAWLYPHDNQLYVQLTLHGKLTANGSDLQHKLDHAFARNPYTERIPTSYEPARAALCRGSTPRLFTHPAQCHYLRVGDAAMAVDPLSGNGIFQSLASALLIRPVVGTLLDPQGDSSLALRFYNERIRELFYRFARIGREFYTLIDESLETEMNAAFWRPRQHWPDHEPLIENDHEVIDIARRPIVDNKRIREDWVVVTRSNPLGIWRVNGRRAIDCVSEAVRRRFGVGKGY